MENFGEVEKSGMGLEYVKRVDEKIIYIYSGVVAPTYAPQTSRKSALRKGFEVGA